MVTAQNTRLARARWFLIAICIRRTFRKESAEENDSGFASIYAFFILLLVNGYKGTSVPLFIETKPDPAP